MLQTENNTQGVKRLINSRRVHTRGCGEGVQLSVEWSELLSEKPQELNFREFTHIFYFQRVGIHATKFEKTRIVFNYDVFAAVAIVVAKAP